ncbi:cytochrome c oxidase subunit 2A [Alkalibacillus almallahensis]|nr:cytochrome c oxidase subunit 2A [Alkalibacillus almallahensis]NIK12048.1 hypothetical protein [Alkalibacillus almallahensis]
MSSRKKSDQNEPKLYGTFISVLIVGIIITLMWIGIFIGFM